MKILKGAETRRVWVPIPGYAQRVQVLLRASSSLDALESTLLRLLAIKPRTIAEAATLLGLSDVHREMVESALEALEDRKLAERAPGGERFSYTGSEPESSVGEIRAGWVFWSGIDHKPIPRLWMGNSLPPGAPSPQEPGFPQADWPPRPNKEQVAAELNALVLREDLVVVESPETCRKTSASILTGLANEDVNDPGNALKAQSLKGIIPATMGRKEFRKHNLFSAVDISPTLMGESIAMYHEPDVLRGGLENRPISYRVEKWVSGSFQQGLDYVKTHAAEVNDKLSEVLRVLGIENRDGLLEEAEDFFRRKACEFGIPDRRVLLGESFEKALRRAQMWLILSSVSTDYRHESNKSFADGIEIMLAALHRESKIILKGFLNNLKTCFPKKDARVLYNQLRSKEYLSKRLTAHGLEGRLGPCRNHLQNNAAPSDWKRYADGNGPGGAGTYLTLWLLPLVLFDSGASEQVDNLARLIRCALDRVPDLFETLNDLVAARNGINHPVKQDGINDCVPSPEVLNDRIMRVWGALEQGPVDSEIQSQMV